MPFVSAILARERWHPLPARAAPDCVKNRAMFLWLFYWQYLHPNNRRFHRPRLKNESLSHHRVPNVRQKEYPDSLPVLFRCEWQHHNVIASFSSSFPYVLLSAQLSASGKNIGTHFSAQGNLNAHLL